MSAQTIHLHEKQAMKIKANGDKHGYGETLLIKALKQKQKQKETNKQTG